ncbi:MAG: alanine:cation symporter family protein [Treponema sp.]|nr:alanine:cation symporter family protein [Treponema sp.]MBD5407236.1 alanine:cation symporter family protein [Treponema sp.]MBD5442920.1 alanine:cation symporter family protein [Treponema sp.]
MELFEAILDKIDGIVWGPILIILILGTGVVLTVRTKGVQFKKLARALKSIVQKPSDGAGEVSSFGALCTALSATIGTGNIVGVATAISTGGPGALFWMWLAALLGMATKYAECMLAVNYREVDANGHVLGGPFYTIEKGMGKKWKWLAILFAVFTMLAGLLGIGTMTQINGITNAVKGVFDPENAHVAITIGGNAISWSVVVAGLIVTVCAALVIIGGIKRISKVASFVVPFMAALYLLIGVFILLSNLSHITEAFEIIFRSAFGARAMGGGALGAMIVAMQKGVARGIFSNEAGLGSAPIAASAAKVEEPVAQGLVSMTGTFIDTIIICTITGLSIVIAGIGSGGEWGANFVVAGEKLSGGDLSTAAFVTLFSQLFGNSVGLEMFVRVLVMICLAFFAFTTILGWDYYAERSIEYLASGRKDVVMAYRILYIVAVFIGPYMTLSAVWTIADITNALMALPNIVSLLVLSGVVAKMTDDYFKRYPKLDIIEPVE